MDCICGVEKEVIVGSWKVVLGLTHFDVFCCECVDGKELHEYCLAVNNRKEQFKESLLAISVSRSQ